MTGRRHLGHLSVGLWLPLVTLLAVSCSRGDAQSERGARSPASGEPTLSVRDLTGVRTRAVWIQGDGSDPRAYSANLILAGFDTDDRRGERVILGERRNYAKPLLTASGDRIVFSSRHTGDIHVVNWDGTGSRRLAEGFALAVWRDPADGRDWIYAGIETVGPMEATGFRRVVRFPIEKPRSAELVWDKTIVSQDSFQLSPDGRLAAGQFPWPHAGVAELPNRGWRKLGDGCWTALAPTDRPLCWYFDGAHRNLTLVDLSDDRRWRIGINKVPGFDGAEVYHPRWTNDARFLTMTGPYNLGGDNQARRGGPQVEVYLGGFSADFARVDRWARITNNNQGDFFPDVWIDPAGNRARQAARGRPMTGSSGGGADRASASSGEARAARLVVEAAVADPGTVPSPQAILPYRHALVVTAYEVMRVVTGRYAERKILVAQWAIREGRVLADARKARGTRYQLTLEPYDAHPELEGERLVVDSRHPDLPIYYDVGR